MENLERIQPTQLSAPDMERQVLGLLMLNPSEGKIIGLPLLTLSDFYETPHRLIYQAIVAVANSGALPETVAVVQLLRQAHQLDGVGGAGYVAGLQMNATGVNLESYCRVLNEHRTKRELLRHAQGIIAALTHEEDVFDVLAAGEKAFTTINQSFTNTTLKTLRSTLSDGFKMLSDRLNNPQQKRVKFGIPSLDNMLGGLEPGDVILYPARPGVGKTDMLVHFARHNGLEQRLPGVIFSLEMTAVQMGFRFTAAPSGVPANITRGNLTGQHLYRLAETLDNEMEGADLIVLDDRPGLTLAAMRATLLQAKAKFPDLAWMAMDYVQLTKGMKGSTAEEAIREASIGLKAAAKEIGIVVLELAQLGREVDRRDPPVPEKADLRGSAQLEMDADFIVLPWRPSFYGLDIDSDGQPVSSEHVKEYVEFIIDKNRHKAPGIAVAKYHPAESRFSSMTPIANLVTINDEDIPY
jgi:replicative DNA helicase